MSAIEEIRAERLRQIETECWSVDHDDEHDDGSLAAAAACYAFNASIDNGSARGLADRREGYVSIIHHMWPASWAWEWWKPKSRRRNLVRAGALIVAEIERLDRAELRATKST